MVQYGQISGKIYVVTHSGEELEEWSEVTKMGNGQEMESSTDCAGTSAMIATALASSATSLLFGGIDRLFRPLVRQQGEANSDFFL